MYLINQKYLIHQKCVIQDISSYSKFNKTSKKGVWCLVLTSPRPLLDGSFFQVCKNIFSQRGLSSLQHIFLWILLCATSVVLLVRFGGNSIPCYSLFKLPFIPSISSIISAQNQQIPGCGRPACLKRKLIALRWILCDPSFIRLYPFHSYPIHQQDTQSFCPCNLINQQRRVSFFQH